MNFATANNNYKYIDKYKSRQIVKSLLFTEKCMASWDRVGSIVSTSALSSWRQWAMAILVYRRPVEETSQCSIILLGIGTLVPVLTRLADPLAVGTNCE